MIDFTEIRRIIETFLQDNFTACPIKQENIPLVPDNPKEWIAVFEKSSFSESTGLGEDSYHLGGVFTFQIFTTLGTGTQRARELAVDLSDLFNSTDISGIAMQTPELYPGPDDPQWYRHHLVIRYSTVTGQDSEC